MVKDKTQSFKVFLNVVTSKITVWEGIEISNGLWGTKISWSKNRVVSCIYIPDSADAREGTMGTVKQLTMFADYNRQSNRLFCS